MQPVDLLVGPVEPSDKVAASAVIGDHRTSAPRHLDHALHDPMPPRTLACPDIVPCRSGRYRVRARWEGPIRPVPPGPRPITCSCSCQVFGVMFPSSTERDSAPRILDTPERESPQTGSKSRQGGTVRARTPSSVDAPHASERPPSLATDPRATASARVDPSHAAVANISLHEPDPQHPVWLVVRGLGRKSSCTRRRTTPSTSSTRGGSGTGACLADG